MDLLDYRVENGLERGRVADGVVDYITDHASDGIALLRRAARRVRSDGCDITPDLVADVRADARAAVREQRVYPMGTYQRVLSEIIRDHDELAGEALHTAYEDMYRVPEESGDDGNISMLSNGTN